MTEPVTKAAPIADMLTPIGAFVHTARKAEGYRCPARFPSRSAAIAAVTVECPECGLMPVGKFWTGRIAADPSRINTLDVATRIRTRVHEECGVAGANFLEGIAPEAWQSLERQMNALWEIWLEGNGQVAGFFLVDDEEEHTP